MPVSRFILIIASVILAAGFSIWLGFRVGLWVGPIPTSGVGFSLALLIGYLFWRKVGMR